MTKKATTFLITIVLFLGFAAFSATTQVQMLIPTKKGNTIQIVPLSIEVVTKTRPLSPQAVLMESPFPGLEALKTAQGSSAKVFKDAPGNLFEEIEVELADKRKKRVFQKLQFGGSETVTGQFQRLHPSSKGELARFFVESFKPEKSVENYAKIIFSMQNLSDKKNAFLAQCRFLKQQQTEVLEKTKIEKAVFDLLLEGTCP